MYRESGIIRSIDKLVNTFVVLVLSILLLYGSFALWDVYMQYQRGLTGDSIMHLKPVEPDYGFDQLLEINKDVCAWLTLDGTHIDYPVLHGEDNAEYLNKDLYGDYYVGGSVFLDYRNSKDFSDSYNLIHGHHMDGGAMFGDLGNYHEEAYFKEHLTGTLYTPERRYRLKVFAYASLDAFDSYVYNPENKTEQKQQEFIDYIMQNAKYVNDIGITPQDKIVALSTCSSAFTDGRSIVFAAMEEIGENEERELKDKTQ